MTHPDDQWMDAEPFNWPDPSEDDEPGWESILPCCDPCPGQGQCDPAECVKFAEHLSSAERDRLLQGLPPTALRPSPPDVTIDEWRKGRCMNCGTQARHVIDGEYECMNCGDTWDIYESPPDVP